MSEISIDYTQSTSDTCNWKCFTKEMYYDVLNSKINNNKTLETALKEVFEDLMTNFNPFILDTNITNHHLQCFHGCKTNIGLAYEELKQLQI